MQVISYYVLSVDIIKKINWTEIAPNLPEDICKFSWENSLQRKFRRQKENPTIANLIKGSHRYALVNLAALVTQSNLLFYLSVLSLYQRYYYNSRSWQKRTCLHLNHSSLAWCLSSHRPSLSTARYGASHLCDQGTIALPSHPLTLVQSQQP